MAMEGLEAAAKKPLLLHVTEIKLENSNINGSQGCSSSSSSSTTGYDFASDPSSCSVTSVVVFSLFVISCGAFGIGNIVSTIY